MTGIIDGKAVAKEVQKQIKEEVEGLERRWGLAPGLAVVVVGDDPASHIYVRNKEKACKEVGIKSFEHLLPATILEKELLSLVQQLNKDKNIHGILVQLPLPPHIRAEKVLEAISPYKDIDGFHPMSQGMLMLGADGFRPCTPMGIMSTDWPRLVAIRKERTRWLSGAVVSSVNRSRSCCSRSMPP